MLTEGKKAPEFLLAGSDGKTHSLKEFAGKSLVLYFYPKDDTPGCTIEAKSFSKSMAPIKKAGAMVVGISADDVDSHCRFSSKYGLGFLLLSDPERKAIEEYGAYGDRGIFGKGILRKTFIIGKDGEILKIYNKVRPLGHGSEVLEFLKGMKNGE